MGYVKNTAVANFGMGKFRSETSPFAEVTTGTPTGAYRADASSGALTGTASYDATAKTWIWSSVQAAAVNGDDCTITFDLAGCVGISHTIRTEAAPLDAAGVVSAMEANGTVLDTMFSQLSTVAQDTGITLPAAIAGLSGGEAREATTYNYDENGNLVSIDYLTTVETETFSRGTDGQISGSTWGATP